MAPSEHTAAKLLRSRLVLHQKIEHGAPKALGKKIFRHRRQCDKTAVGKKRPVGGEHVQKALREHAGNARASVPEALAAFEAARRPIVEKLVAGADASADWYERFPEHMRLAPREFAWSYIQRSGRIDPEKLRRIAPKFVGG